MNGQTAVNVLLMFGHDGYVRPSYNFMKTLQQSGFSTTIANCAVNGRCLSARQCRPLQNVPSLNETKLVDLCSKRSFDHIFLGFGGQHLIHYIRKMRQLAPHAVLVAYYPGLNRLNGFKGCVARYEADVILFNCDADVSYYRDLCANVGGDASNARLLGYPQFSAVSPKSKITSVEDIRQITYFDQNIVPASLAQRRYLIQSLKQLAHGFPEKTFTIQLRNRSGETSAHPEKYALNALATVSGTVPENLSFNDDDLVTQIERTDLALGISSTVLIECINRRILTYSILDFGIHDDYANFYFSGSGVLKTMADVLTNPVSYPNEEWISRSAQSYNANVNEVMAELPYIKPQRRQLPEALMAYLSQEEWSRSEKSKSLLRRIGTFFQRT